MSKPLLPLAAAGTSLRTSIAGNTLTKGVGASTIALHFGFVSNATVNGNMIDPTFTARYSHSSNAHAVITDGGLGAFSPVAPSKMPPPKPQ